ncbi:MAG: hypothetical protein M1819_003409 [Sarea resinae]|nr:MAG: hypothetical protein M1819_003409 [Sarea resinae]
MAGSKAAEYITPGNKTEIKSRPDVKGGDAENASIRDDSSSKDFDASDLDGDCPISYHYLTFETKLPSPSTLVSSKPGTAEAPPPPDLIPYTSPFLWSSTRKRCTTWLACLGTALTAYAAGSYSMASDQLTAYWDVSPVAVAIGITTFCVGFATAPMVLAPFSEINGRKPIFVVTGVLFIVCQTCTAVTRSFPGMIVARFFVGVGGSTFSTMVGGVISDIYHTADRNTPMALFSGSALFGTGLGPLVSGFIAQNTTWRWIFYVQIIDCSLMVLAVLLFFRESRGSVLLSRKAKALNEWYAAREQLGYVGFDMPINGDSEKTESQRIRWKVKSDEERESIQTMIKVSLYRPFHLLITEPVVFFFSLWVAFSWAVLYLTFDAIPLVFSTRHGFTLQQTGAVFAAMCIGASLATILSICQEKLALRYGKTFSTPEERLYFACVESALLPIGLFWFGWTSFSSVPWIVPAIGIGCATMGIYSVYLAAFNYLADTYHRYASSAIAAQSFCRNMLGGVIPLFTDAMYRGMTFQGASSLLGGLGAVLTAVPWVLALYGPTIRARSKFASHRSYRKPKMSPKRVFEHCEAPSYTNGTPFLFSITLDRPKRSLTQRMSSIFTKKTKTPGRISKGDRKWDEWEQMLETRYRTLSYVFRSYHMKEYEASCLRKRLEEYGEYGHVY